MKAVIYKEYGNPDVLQVQDVETPTPKANEILIRVHAAPVNFGDLLARNFGNVSPGKFNMPLFFWLPARLAFGFRKPQKPILGSEFAGEVEAVGSAVTRFKAGDAVFGYRGQQMGTYAEYLCMPEDGLVALKPDNVTYEEAAGISYGALTALSLLRKVGLQAGQKVLINGASGGIGSYALQLARHFGAQVTAVCGSPSTEMVKALGADAVIDYTREDFTRSGETYDLIIDILGKRSFRECKRALTPNGRLLYVSFKTRQLLQMLWTSVRGGRKIICALSGETRDDMALIAELLAAGKITSIIDRCYPMEAAAEAHRYAESGQKAGAIIISMGHPEPVILPAPY